MNPRRMVPYLFIAALAAATIAGLVVRPESPGAEPAADQVIIAGAAGLRWDDLDPQRTPNLWRLAEAGAIGSMSVRSAHNPTCVADGWLTLGAGNWAGDRTGDRLHGGTTGPPSEPCPPLDVSVENTAGAGAMLPQQEDLVRYNQSELPWGAVPGALAGSVECTVAYGEGAAVAAARSFGRVDWYAAELPSEPQRLADTLAAGRDTGAGSSAGGDTGAGSSAGGDTGAGCELAIVDLGAVGIEGDLRAAQVRRVDTTLGRVLDARPAGSLVLVTGVADTGDDQHLQVAIGHGPGLPAGWLSSSTTGRTGYVQLVDLAPTVLAAVDRPPPEVPLAGNPITVRPDRPPDLTEAVTELVATDREAVQARPVAPWFLAALTVAQLALFAVVLPLLRRPELPGTGRPSPLRTAVSMLLVAAALAIPAALTTGALPWWRAEAAGRVFTVTSLAVLAAAAVLVARTPVFRRTLGLVGAAAAVAAAAVGVDLVTGSWLQLNSVVGYSAHDGGRYSGLGEIGLGVLIASTMLVAGCLAEQVPRRRRPLVVAVVGALGVVLAGSPYLGDNIGGAVAMLVGVCLAAALCTGGWLTARRVSWAVLVGLTIVVVVALFDLREPVESRTGLGSLLTQVAEGTAGLGAHQVSLANGEALTGSPLTVLAIGAGAFLWFALLRSWGGLRRLFGIHPALRAGVIGAVAAGLLGGILIGAALTVAGAVAAVGVPLLALASLRLRQHPVRQPAPAIPAVAAPAVGR